MCPNLVPKCYSLEFGHEFPWHLDYTNRPEQVTTKSRPDHTRHCRQHVTCERLFCLIWDPNGMVVNIRYNLKFGFTVASLCRALRDPQNKPYVLQGSFTAKQAARRGWFPGLLFHKPLLRHHHSTFLWWVVALKHFSFIPLSFVGESQGYSINCLLLICQDFSSCVDAWSTLSWSARHQVLNSHELWVSSLDIELNTRRNFMHRISFC